MPIFILLVGLNHRTAPIEVREKLAWNERTKEKALHELQAIPGIEGSVILSTCNRFEIYCAAQDIDQGTTAINRYLLDFLKTFGIGHQDVFEYLYAPTCQEAVGHLFRVAAGLDSMVIGESQILGQVREAYEFALNTGATNGVINTLFQQALAIGKRVRTETLIDRNAVSISSAAVELAKQIIGPLEGHSVLVIGAGETGELTTRHLIANGVTSVMVSNRSPHRAQELAKQFCGQATSFAYLLDSLKTADIVISCTAACHLILSYEQVQSAIQARPERPLIIIDIAVPRDVDPQCRNLDQVHLFDIDDLNNVVDANYNERQQEAVKAELIVKDELIAFNTWLNTRFVIPTIVALRNKAENIRHTELNRALNRLGNITEREEKILTSLTNSIVNQLLYEPIKQLKAFANTNNGHLYTEILQEFFQLNVTDTEDTKETDYPEEALQ